MKTITIIGGGLAGLTLGIGLRRNDVPVVIWEAGHYPRHRVCGEFISGRGLQTLKRMGLLEKLHQAGAVQASTAAFFSAQKQRGLHILPEPALCLSRFRLDALLAEEFRRKGGELKEGSRWMKKELEEGMVRASGRRIQAMENGWRLFGIKAHARNVTLSADLEMHFRSDGYVGLCRLADGWVNICGLLRSEHPIIQMGSHWKEMLQGSLNSPLSQRLERAAYEESSFCAIAGLALRPKSASHLTECVIGDAVTMIPPVTGNGMSMAFESAELALKSLQKFSSGQANWQESCETNGRNFDRSFRRRLFWADWMQRGLLHPIFGNGLLNLSGQYSHFWKFFFSKTR